MQRPDLLATTNSTDGGGSSGAETEEEEAEGEKMGLSGIYRPRRDETVSAGFEEERDCIKIPLSPRFSGWPLNKGNQQLCAINAEVMSRSNQVISRDDVIAGLQKPRRCKKEGYARFRRLT